MLLRNSTPKYREMKTYVYLKTLVYTNAYSSIIHDSQKVEATQMSTD